MRSSLLLGVAALLATSNNFYYYSAEALPVNAEIPDDPEFFRQWGLEQINDIDIDAITAWQILAEKCEIDKLVTVTVAVLDGSIGLDNIIEFEGQTVPGCDIKEALQRLGSVEKVTIDKCNDPKLEFPYVLLGSHGNGVAGIIAAAYNNSNRISGVAGPYPIKIMPLKGYSGRWLGTNEKPRDFHLNDQYFAAAVKLAADNGARVFCTAVGYEPTEVNVEVMREAVRYANEKGMLIVVSAGNYPQPGGFPAGPFNPDVLPGSIGEPNVISVGSITPAGRLAADWDGSGEESQDSSVYGRYVDVVAPGTSIVTTTTDKIFLIVDTPPLQGTSFASPFVAGIAALTLLAYPQLSVNQLKEALIKGVQQTGELMFELSYCEKTPTKQMWPWCYKDCNDPDDKKLRTRLVQSGGYVRAPLVLEEAARILGETITLGGEAVGAYPKSVFAVKKDGVEPAAHVRNWEGLETGDGEEVEFSAVPNSDYVYAWDFGDGLKGKGQNVAHSYTKPGVYRAKLTVKDVKTSLQDESPPLRVTVYPKFKDHIRIERTNQEEEETLLADTYLIHSSFDIQTKWFLYHRVKGSGYFEVGGNGYSLALETRYPFFGVTWKMFVLEAHGEDSTSRVVWTIGGIDYKQYENGSETMAVNIPPYKFTVTVSNNK